MANIKNLSKKSKSQSMGMHAEVLKGRTQQRFFDSEEAENFYYFGNFDVDLNKRKVAEFDQQRTKIMDSFINENNDKFKNENLKFIGKLKK